MKFLPVILRLDKPADDGEYHYEDETTINRDSKRDVFLEEAGFRVLKVRTKEVENSLEEVTCTIKELL